MHTLAYRVFCSVMDTIMSSEVEFGCLQGDNGERKVSDQNSVLSFMAATWDYYGGRYLYMCGKSIIRIDM